jgi:two-component system, LytTR family, response regulator
MKDSKTIRTAIIDDKQEHIDSLKGHLSLFPEIELCGCATRYKQASKLLIDENPDLVFLDIEMPCKNGFELLNEARETGSEFSVIFYTAYDKYMIRALRESAFDFILKPVRYEELKDAIDRFKIQHHFHSETVPMLLSQGQTVKSEIIALPTYYGIQFMNINRILMFRSSKTNLVAKSSWEGVLTDKTTMRLARGVSAERISSHFKDRFFQINQSCIVNLSYLSIVEYKTRQCTLLSPFDKIELTVSRTQLSKLKERFDTF